MTDQRNNETEAEFQARKTQELAAAAEQHFANASVWATMAVYGPPECRNARLDMAAYELRKAGK